SGAALLTFLAGALPAGRFAADFLAGVFFAELPAAVFFAGALAVVFFPDDVAVGVFFAGVFFAAAFLPPPLALRVALAGSAPDPIFSDVPPPEDARAATTRCLAV